MNWIEITQIKDIDDIKKQSNINPCVIFKHSTRCGISSIAKLRFEAELNESVRNFHFYYLDLIKYRSISNRIAELFKVYHESPQILVILNEESVFDASHLDISMQEISDELEYISQNG